MNAKPGTRNAERPQSGFTLVELIIVIVISGILAGAVTTFIARAIQGYDDATRRAALVNAADTALTRMARDIHRALPNSLRVSGGTVLEMLDAVDGARYRDDPPGDTSKQLEFDKADTQFNLLGQFVGITRPFSSSGDYLVIYNVGVPGATAYEGANVITPAGTSIGIDADAVDPTEDHVTLGAGFQFVYRSPTQRIYLVDTPISYVCTGGNLYRYANYPVSATQLDSDAALTGAGASRALLANQVSACRFTYQPGTSQRAGLATLQLTLADGSGEQITLLHQVHVDNTP